MDNGRVEKNTGNQNTSFLKKNSKLNDFCMFGQTVRGLKDFR